MCCYFCLCGVICQSNSKLNAAMTKCRIPKQSKSTHHVVFIQYLMLHLATKKTLSAEQDDEQLYLIMITIYFPGIHCFKWIRFVKLSHISNVAIMMPGVGIWFWSLTEYAQQWIKME